MFAWSASFLRLLTTEKMGVEKFVSPLIIKLNTALVRQIRTPSGIRVNVHSEMKIKSNELFRRRLAEKYVFLLVNNVTKHFFVFFCFFFFHHICKITTTLTI